MNLTWLDVATVGGVWAAFLWFREYRTARTLAILGVASAAVLATDMASPVLGVVLTACIAAGLFILHVRFGHWISAHTRDEQEFRRGFGEANNRLSRAYQNYERSGDRSAFRQSLLNAYKDVESLSAPGPGWEEVRVAALRLLSDRLVIHDSHTEASPRARMQFRSDRAALHAMLERTSERTARFW